MNRTQYQRILQPVFDEMISLFIESETKHCEGIQCRDEDALKGVGHAISSMLGKHNPDGHTHVIAALSRLTKVALKELEDG